MTEPAKARKNPCASCPYRRDVPSGVWDASEYDKLPAYDAPTYEQPPGLFMCHQGQGDICSGWVAHSDPHELLALRLAVTMGSADPSCFEHTTTVPLFGSGTEASEHGRNEIENPDPRARATIKKVVRVRGMRGSAGGSA